MTFLPSTQPPHRCSLPEIRRWFRRSLPQGTRWQCDECQGIWVIRPIALRPTIGFWSVESPRPPKTSPAEMPPPPIPTRRTW